ncbi:uncharacterized protein BDV14DRAFT_188364 [Aspergillus stella-maris]|uniref:uncharacterized protein n=1 Tax=Aspergillus stella-maris TaxID=1810926 RepID=UPI003CCDF7AE
MDYYGGLGPMINAVLWVEAIIFAVFVGLQLYTRHRILNAVGIDYYICCFALVLHLLYTNFVSIATRYGLGRLKNEIGRPPIYVEAVKYEIFSQVAGILLMGLGKCVVGTFLLRIVRNKIQIPFLHACLGQPVEKMWDILAEGDCWINFSKVGYTVGSWFVAMDFSFAILPWFVVWHLHMKHKEKITVACGLSLGIFAGVCGIVRTVALSGLSAQEYVYDTVPMLIWSATKSCATIMCSFIPDGTGSSSGNSSYKLPLYARTRNYGKLTNEGLGISHLSTIDPSYANVTVSYGTINHENNTSNEDILRGALGIERTDEISVSYEQFARKL